MIRLSFKITWPLLFLVALALLVWLWRRSQAQPVTRPLGRVITPAADGTPAASESTFDRLEREAAEAGRRAYHEPTETGAAERLRNKHYAQR